MAAHRVSAQTIDDLRIEDQLHRRLSGENAERSLHVAGRYIEISRNLGGVNDRHNPHRHQQQCGDEENLAWGASRHVAVTHTTLLRATGEE
jgi:hypothetical protein